MGFHRSHWATLGSTTLFVLLWSSGAIFSRLGLDHASPFAFLTLRYLIALGVLLALGLNQRHWLPAPGTRARVATAGALLLGGYSIGFLLALDHGITPGVLVTVLGVQPILTLLLYERRFSAARLLGLGLALGGLLLVVYHGIVLARFSVAGMLFALASLAAMTSGAILQKGVKQAPLAVLPLQYATSLLLCLVFLPFQPFAFAWSAAFLIPLLWLGIVISVVAQLLLYRLIQIGNLVNVTSLFYLVPAVTAIMDYLVLGNPLSAPSMAGMGAILMGLALVFRTPARARTG